MDTTKPVEYLVHHESDVVWFVVGTMDEDWRRRLLDEGCDLIDAATFQDLVLNRGYRNSGQWGAEDDQQNGNRE